jgi:site-specific DNA-methyltransferase (adenine-specific)
MDYMNGLEPNAFELAIVDPPYGIERFKKPSGTTRFKSSKLMQEEGLTWDNKPTNEYWNELFRISKNQIVWGANNFIMPPSEYFLIWNKKQTVDNFASAEYAWVSMGLKKPAKIYDYGIHKHNTITKIHPTQKPVKLYRWLLKNYAKQGDRILDTHLGSGSSAIAAYDEGFDFVGIELDREYYDGAVKRFRQHISQTSLF